jgi:hypothetical protein
MTLQEANALLRGHTGISPYRSMLFLLRHVCGTSAARDDSASPMALMTNAKPRNIWSVTAAGGTRFVANLNHATWSQRDTNPGVRREGVA